MFGRKTRDAKLAAICKHQWKTVGASFSETSISRAKNVSEKMMMYMDFGCTTVTQECTLCHKIETTNTPGKVNLPGFVWKDQE